jgi:hypothetical protein
MYKFKNSLIAMGGLAVIAVAAPLVMPFIGFGSNAASGNAPTSQAQNVNVVNTPTVSSQQNGTWNVGINGTAGVNVMNTATVSAQQSGTWNVNLSGTPTVNVGAPQTILAYDQTMDFQNNSSGVFPPLDTSNFKEVRIVFSVLGGSNFLIWPRLVDPQDTGNTVFLDQINAAQLGDGTALYEMPGQKMDFFVMNQTGSPVNLHIQVFGRSN